MNPTNRFYNSAPCPAEPVYGFDEIRKGDKVKLSRKHADGTTLESVGVADELASLGWRSSGGAYVAIYNNSDDWTDSYELLERADPPKDHAIVRIYDDRGRVIASKLDTLEGCKALKVQWESDTYVRPSKYAIVKLVDVDV